MQAHAWKATPHGAQARKVPALHSESSAVDPKRAICSAPSVGGLRGYGHLGVATEG